MPPDGSRLKENASATKPRQPRAYRIPLIPTHKRADTAVLRVEVEKTGIARREVKLLVVQRVVRDVHFAIDPEHLPIGIENCSRVVIEARRAAFEQRRNNSDLGLAGN